MRLSITHQSLYSRGELLLRTVLGALYIGLPHAFLLMFLMIWSGIIGFISFWVVLFTGRYPQSFFEFQVGLKAWGLRVQAAMMNLIDGYPPFGLSQSFDKVQLEVPYPEQLDRGLVLVRMFFGMFYVVIPHYFCLWFRLMLTQIYALLAWWVVLFTGSYPQSWHEFNVGTLRWMTRVQLYMSLMTDDYPPFSGKPQDGEQTAPIGEPAAQPA